MTTTLQKCTIQAIVNIFETGKPAGDYARVTLAKGDAGHLSYGRSQASLASGNLSRLVRDYCEEPGALHARELSAYLSRLDARDLTLDSDAGLHALLRVAGADPVMCRVEDTIFDRVYWDPALRAAQATGIETALGTAVVYDSFIHGGWVRMRDATAASLGVAPAQPQILAGGRNEHEWIGRYISVRRNWLANHANPLLRLTTYRLDTFAALVATGNWTLALPLEAHGVRITGKDLGVQPALEHVVGVP
jgi:chitosanase